MPTARIAFSRGTGTNFISGASGVFGSSEPKICCSSGITESALETWSGNSPTDLSASQLTSRSASRLTTDWRSAWVPANSRRLRAASIRMSSGAETSGWMNWAAAVALMLRSGTTVMPKPGRSTGALPPTGAMSAWAGAFSSGRISKVSGATVISVAALARSIDSNTASRSASASGEVVESVTSPFTCGSMV